MLVSLALKSNTLGNSSLVPAEPFAQCSRVDRTAAVSSDAAGSPPPKMTQG
jgi:hypothetical protein